MPPRRRGTAQPVKKSRNDKYKTVDSDSDEVLQSIESDGPSLDSNCAKGPKKSRSKISEQRNLSTDHGSLPAPQLQHGSQDRQDSFSERNSNEQSSKSHKGLERTLFSDLFDPAGNTQKGDILISTGSTALQQDLRLLQLRSPEQRPKKTPKKSGAQSQQPPASTSQRSATAPRSPQLAVYQSIATSSRQQQRTDPLPPPLILNDDDNDEDAAMSGGSYIAPNQQRHMRACMVCSVVRTEQQFKQNGCPNCEAFLELAGNIEAIQECTSQVFEGLLTVSDTSRSWVARSQRLEGYVPGVYAVQVEGVLPEEAIAAAENAGVHYMPRDGTVNEALPTDS